MEQNKLQKVLKASVDFAQKLGSATVETEHLLFGVLSEEMSNASKILNGYGISKQKYASVVKTISKNSNLPLGSTPVLSKNVSLIFSNISENQGNLEDLLYLLLSKKGFKSFVIISLLDYT